MKNVSINKIMSNQLKNCIEYIQKLKSTCIDQAKKKLNLSNDTVIDGVVCKLLSDKICVQFIINDKIYKIFLSTKIIEALIKNKSIKNTILEF